MALSLDEFLTYERAAWRIAESQRAASEES
jgi:hypothetical protein